MTHGGLCHHVSVSFHFVPILYLDSLTRYSVTGIGNYTYETCNNAYIDFK
jgi:hypothetical protein